MKIATALVLFSLFVSSEVEAQRQGVTTWTMGQWYDDDKEGQLTTSPEWLAH